MTDRIAVLGPIRIAGRDAGGVAMRTLVATLALSRVGESRSLASLADDVWGDHPPQNPRAALQTLVSRLRAHGGADIVASVPGGYARAAATDLDRARELLEATEAAEHDHGRILDILDEADALWRGEPAVDLPDVPAADALVRDAAGLRDRIRRARAAALRGAGRPAEAVAVLEALAVGSPRDEPLHIALVEALDAAGRTADALAVFAAYARRLRDELGSSPGAGFVELNARLLRGAPKERAAPVRIGVDAEPNVLIGRDEAVREAEEMLRRARLVTVLGPGGLGKTRLAQAVAARSDASMVVVVPLAGVRTDADVGPAVAAALGISETAPGGRLSDPRARPDLRARMVAALADREALLVLDNCEQVIGGVAAWCSDLLATVPSLQILATSRAPVMIAAEQILPLVPLAIAESVDSPAVRLFLERARAVRPGAELSLATVTRLCAHLDGLPLAIELAAARVRTMTAEQIEVRLQNRFALLTKGDRSAPERHRTLEAVISWSWDLLDDGARTALAALSVLPGGFSGVAASALLGVEDAADMLDRLVEQSLLVASEHRTGMRFRMLETVREFGLVRLAEAGSGAVAAAEEAVTAWALALIADHGPPALRFPGGLRPEAQREIGAEHDNLVHVLRGLLAEGRHAEAVRIYAVVGQSWFMRGSYAEIAAMGAPMLTAARSVSADVSVDERAIATLLATLGCLIGDDPRGLRGIVSLRGLARTEGERLSPVWGALCATVTAATREADTFDVLRRVTTVTDPRARLAGELLLSHFAENLGETRQALAAAERAWALAESLDEPWGAAMAADSAAQLASQSARPAEAIVWLQRAHHRYDQYDAEEPLRQAEWVRGGVLLALDRLEEAEEVFASLVRGGELTADALEISAVGWYGLGEVYRLSGRMDDAREALDRAMRMFRSPQQRRSPWFLMAVAGYVSAAAEGLDLGAEEIEKWVRRLRGRAVAGYRLRPQATDRPVLGTVLLGWSSWALTQPGRSTRAVEALVLAERLGARQDLPSLRIHRHRERAERIVGADAVARAQDAIAGVPLADLVPRAVAVLGG